jgi:hypothetical protein
MNSSYYKVKSIVTLKCFLRNLKNNYDLTIKTNKKSKNNNLDILLATIILVQ